MQLFSPHLMLKLLLRHLHGKKFPMAGNVLYPYHLVSLWLLSTDVLILRNPYFPFLLHFHSFKFKQPSGQWPPLSVQGTEVFSLLVRTLLPGWFCRTLRSSVTSRLQPVVLTLGPQPALHISSVSCGWLASLCSLPPHKAGLGIPLS